MTIGVGFVCSDGVVICADRQLTVDGGFKFHESKLSHSLGNYFSVIFSYAGYPDEAQAMFTRISEELQERMKKTEREFPYQRATAALEEIFKDTKAEGLQTLIGIKEGHHASFLMRTQNHTVVRGVADTIGSGDSSAIRYVCDFLLSGYPTVRQAQILGSYIVSVATRYVDKCGGGPDHIIINENGSITQGTGGPFFNARERFLYCEAQMGNGLRDLLLSGGTKVIETREATEEK